MVHHYREGFQPDSSAWRSVKAALREASTLTRKHGSEFVVALYPVLWRLDDRYPFRDLHRTIEAFCDSEGIPFVDLFPAFIGESDSEMWVHRVDQHPNETAHDIAGRWLAEHLRDNVL